MQMDVAPPLREDELALGRQILIAREDHEIVETRRTDLAQNFVVQFLRKIDAVDLGAERPGYGMDLDVAVLAVSQFGHRHSSSGYGHGRRSISWTREGGPPPWGTAEPRSSGGGGG